MFQLTALEILFLLWAAGHYHNLELWKLYRADTNVNNDKKKMTLKKSAYVSHTKERYEKGRNNDEEGEQLSVLVEEFKLINQPRDHWFHPAHLQQKTEE